MMGNTNIVKSLYLLTTFVVILSCKKDKTPIVENDIIPYCPENYFSHSSPIPDTIQKAYYINGCPFSPTEIWLNDYYYSDPVVNPNNPFHIAFYRGETSNFGSNRELCTYNFCTNELKVLANNILFSLDWSITDWIIFTGNDLQVWKIKSNGDSLTKLTNTGDYNNYPIWNDDGNMFISTDASLGNCQMNVRNQNGNSISTHDVCMEMDGWDWLPDNNIVYRSGNTLYKYDLSNNISTLICNHAAIDGPISINNGVIYTSNLYGIYRVDINGNVDKIDSNYHTFTALSITPIFENQLLLNRFYMDTTYGNSNCTLYYDRYLTLYNKIDKSERKILIPE